MKYLFLKIFLLLPAFLWAQEARFRSGYIVTLDNDTIRGEIMLRTDEQNSRLCIFREGSQGAERRFSPTELRSYHFVNGKHYFSQLVTIEQEPEQLFLECLVKGGLTLYYYTTPFVQYYFFYDEKDGTLIAVDNKKREVSDGHSDYQGVDLRYRGVSRYVMRKWNEAEKRSKHLGFNHEDMIGTVVDYNNAVCTDQDCVVYEVNDPTPSHWQWGVFGGYAGNIAHDYQKSLSGYEIGVQFSFISPRFSPSLAFLAEVTYAGSGQSYAADPNVLTYGEFKAQCLAFKVGGRYIFGKSALRPFVQADGQFAFEIGEADDTGVSALAGAGLLYRVFRKHDIFVQGYWNVCHTQRWGLRAGFLF